MMTIASRLPSRFVRRSLVPAAITFCFAPPVALANPTGANVISGQVSISQQGPLLTVNNSPGSIINWQGFSIGAGEITRFVQQSASSAVLNRVVGANPSTILGMLQSNGRVFLLNPNGIAIGHGAQIDVAGLVASTLNMSDADFLSGRLRFQSANVASPLTNAGEIRTPAGGRVLLVAPGSVENTGVITAPNGEVILAAGRSVELVDSGTPNVRVELTAPDSQAVNLGQVVARSGQVGIYGGIVRQAGSVNADAAVVGENGRVVLRAIRRAALESAGVTSASGGLVDVAANGAPEGERSTILHQGRVHADGPDGGTVKLRADSVLSTGVASADGTGKGGQVVISASDRVLATASSTLSARGGSAGGGEIDVRAGSGLYTSGTIDASGDVGGVVRLLGNDVKLVAAKVNVDGEHRGGTLRVGGGFQGKEPLPNSLSTRVDANSVLSANARASGDGGSVVLWSDGETRFSGRISAHGGAASGNGGFVEVSGKEGLGFTGNVAVGAPAGSAGTLLLDPKNIVIVPGGGATLGIELVDPNPSANAQFSSNVTRLSNDNLVALDPKDGLAGTNAGAAYLFDSSTGALIGAVVGNSANEQLGNLGLQFGSLNNNYILRSPDAAAGAATQAGAVIMVSNTTGLEVGRVAGVSSGERLGNSGLNFLGNGNYVITSPNRTVAGNANAGAVVLADGATGVQLGQVQGNAATERLGNLGIQTNFQLAGNYLVRSPDANGLGGVTQGGAVILVSATTGAEIGRIAGNAASERLGALGIQFGALNNNYIVRSPDAATGGVAQAGAVIMASPATGLETGRVSGVSTGERLGNSGLNFLNNGNYVLLSPNRTVSGNANAGAAVLADGATGAQLGQVEGNAVNERLGNLGLQFSSVNDNYILRSPDASAGSVAQAGAIIMASATTGNETGRVAGVSTGERLGNSFFTTLGNGNYVVPSPNRTVLGNANAGAVVLADGATGAQLGQVEGNAVNERLGNVGITTSFNLGNNYLIRSPDATVGSSAQAGAVILASGASGAEVGRMSGASANERFGNLTPTFLNSGHYVVRSPNRTVLGNANAGAVVLGSSATGMELGRVEGNAPSELLGNQSLIFSQANDNYIIRSPDASVGTVTQAGAVIMASATTGMETGRVSGVSASERLGNLSPTFLNNSHYVIRSPNRTASGNANAGAVVLADGTSGAQIGQIEGNAANERLGNLTVSFSQINDNYIVRSPDAADSSRILNQVGAVIMADATTGLETGRVSGTSTGERLGNLSPTFLGNGNYVIRSPNRTVSSNANAGAIVLAAGGTGQQLGQVEGGAANELLGNINITTNFNLGNNFLARSPDASAGGSILQAGAVIQIDGVSGMELGRVSGVSAIERLGNTAPTFLSNGNYAIRSPNRTVGANANAGAVVLGSASSGTELGAIQGNAPNELLGSLSLQFSSTNNNYIVRSPDANGAGGVMQGGAVIMGSATTGLETGRIAGTSVGERLGNLSPTFLTNGNYVVRSPTRTVSGNINAGAVVLADGALGSELGRVEGNAANEQLGALGISTNFQLGGNYLIRSPNAAAGAFAQAGAVILASATTGAELGRVSGNSASELLGNTNPTFLTNSVGSNYVIASPLADAGAIADAGAVILASGATGAEIGRVSGNAPNELMGTLGINTNFQLGGNYVVRSPDADGVGGAAKGGAVVLVNSATGTEIGRTSGTSSNERFGTASLTFLDGSVGSHLVMPSTLADSGGLADTGAVVTINSVTGTEVGRVFGNAANEQLGSLGIITDFRLPNTFLVRSPNATANGLAQAGAILTVSRATGTEVGRATGRNANDRFGNQFPDFFTTGDFLVRNGDANLGPLTQVGAVVLVSGTTGQEVARLTGTSANERLGDNVTNPFAFGSDRRLVRSTGADVNGLTDAGRLFVVGPGLFGANDTASSLLFGTSPGGDATLSATAIINALASGAELILQANNDITLSQGAELMLTGTSVGKLKLQAGRSIKLNANISLPTEVTMIANETLDGVVSAQRDTGTSEIVFAPGVKVGSSASFVTNATTMPVAITPTSLAGLTTEGGASVVLDGGRLVLKTTIKALTPDQENAALTTTVKSLDDAANTDKSFEKSDSDKKEEKKVEERRRDAEEEKKTGKRPQQCS